MALAMIFFPDTNFFLHFRDPPEIPWATVTSDDTVILLICDNTARELDKKKFELRGRAQDRARKWASILGEIVDTGGPKILRATGPKVIVDLQVERPLGWIPPNDLESHNLGDDKYIADVLAYKSTANGQQCAILTADTGPLLKAKRHGLTSVRIKDDWGLPEEPDSRARTIKRLEEELAKERKRGPERLTRNGSAITA